MPGCRINRTSAPSVSSEVIARIILRLFRIIHFVPCPSISRISRTGRPFGEDQFAGQCEQQLGLTLRRQKSEPKSKPLASYAGQSAWATGAIRWIRELRWLSRISFRNSLGRQTCCSAAGFDSRIILDTVCILHTK